MHRQRTRLAARVPPLAQPAARAVERSGIVATYELHDHILANRTARRLFANNRPHENAVQSRLLGDLDAEGYATVPFEELLGAELRRAVERQGEEFVSTTERSLANGDGELRRRPGKEFLIRAHSFEGVTVGLEHAWFRACVSAALLDLANAYLRMWSKLSYVDLWYTVPQPQKTERVASQLWHHDFDDKHLLKAFLYLRSVDEGTGPFEYVAGSQPGGPYHDVRPWKPMGYGRVPEEDVNRRVSDGAVRTFTAPRGTLIFCNTSGLHRGGFATAGPRVLATATYCSPASLAALSERNYELDPSQLGELSPRAQYAVS